jgi:hypothetical protein
MTPLTTASTTTSHGVRDDLTAEEWVSLEALEDLPVRLEPEALAAIIALHEQGKAPSTISRLVSLHRVVVTLELCRELRLRIRQRQTGPDHSSGVDSELQCLTRREWNRLVKGSHVPNQTLRNMLETAIRFRPDSSERSLIDEAKVSVTHAKRMLGMKPYPKAKRCSQTLERARAASIARALGRDPTEVPGL